MTDWRSHIGLFKSDGYMRQALALFVCTMGLTGCITPPPTRMVFKSPMSDAEWSRVDRECSYESEKATAAASPKVDTTFTRRWLFVLCAEMKGAMFAGSVTMPEEQWLAITAACKQDVAQAISGEKPSRHRDELREDLEIECAKRKGAVFRPTYHYYP